MATATATTASGHPEGAGPLAQQPLPPASKADYIITATQSYISRAAQVCGAPNLTTRGKSVIEAGAVVRGDFGAQIHVGRYCLVDRGAEIVPSVVPTSNDPLSVASRPADADEGAVTPPGENERALPVIIGSHTQIGENTRVRSVTVGSCVRVGSDCVLSPRSKVHDCCVIEDGTVIPPDMVVPPFSRVRGCPGRIVGSLPECCGSEFVDACVRDYLSFLKGLRD